MAATVKVCLAIFVCGLLLEGCLGEDLSKCYQCDDVDSKCPATNTSSAIKTCSAGKDKPLTACRISKYFNPSKNVFYIKRECITDANNKCDTAQKNDQKIVNCNECDKDNCNTDLIPAAEKILCIECEDCEETINDITSDKIKYCRLDSNTKTHCYAYKGQDGKYYRGCGNKDTCSNQLEKDKKTWMCNLWDKSLSNRDVNNGKNKCIKCDSSNSTQSYCKDDSTPNTDSTVYTDDTVNTQCIAYRYLNDQNEIVTVRDIGSTTTCNEIKTTKNLTMCNYWDSTANNLANSNIYNGKKTCIKCDSSNDKQSYCKNDNLTDVEITKSTSYMDDTVKTTCLTYRYLDENYKIRTIRSTAPKDFCKSKKDIYCDDSCSTANCNTAINTDKETVKCIQCDSSTDRNCSSKLVDLSALTNNTCTLDATKTACFTWEYQDTTGARVKRGCATESDSKKYDSSSSTYFFAKFNKTNYNQVTIDIDTKQEKQLCMECEGDSDSECGKDVPASVTTFCTLDGKVNTVCVAYKYKYANDTVMTRRTCGSKDTCSKFSEKDATLLMCNQWKAGSVGTVSNQNIHNKRTTCITCSSNDKNQQYCSDDVIDEKTNVNQNYMDDTVNTKCIAYRYAKDENTTITVRAMSHECNKIKQNIQNLTMCNQWDSTNGNDSINRNIYNKRISCIQCSSDNKAQAYCNNDSVSGKDITQSISYVDDTVNPECVTYRYLDDNFNVKTIRSNAPAKTCNTLNLKKPIVCNSCHTSDSCNNQIDASQEKFYCLQCESINATGSNNDANYCLSPKNNLNKLTNYCTLNVSNPLCATWEYQGGENVQVKRGCISKTDSTNYESASKTFYFDKCEKNQLCNINNILKAQEKTLCVECDDDGDCNVAHMSLDKVTSYCALNGNTTSSCVVYQYTDKDKNTRYHRGCAAKSACDSLKKNGLNNATLKSCSDCTENLCNKNGAPSIVVFALLPLVMIPLLSLI